MNVHLVRVGETWRVFADIHAADTFYRLWSEFRDSEFLGNQYVDQSSRADVISQWERGA